MHDLERRPEAVLSVPRATNPALVNGRIVKFRL